jgi:hypothetical protein
MSTLDRLTEYVRIACTIDQQNGRRCVSAQVPHGFLPAFLRPEETWEDAFTFFLDAIEGRSAWPERWGEKPDWSAIPKGGVDPNKFGEKLTLRSLDTTFVVAHGNNLLSEEVYLLRQHAERRASEASNDTQSFAVLTLSEYIAGLRS